MNKHRKGLTLIIIVLAILILAGIMGASYYLIKIAPEASTNKTADWQVYTNNRVGYMFKYPKEVSDLEETIKYQNSIPNFSQNEDLVQFGANETGFVIKTYVGEGTSTIESWIQNSEIAASSNLNDYEKITVGGRTAYQMVGDGFIYVLANGNVYQISAYKDIAPIKINEEPIFEEWVSTIKFK